MGPCMYECGRCEREPFQEIKSWAGDMLFRHWKHLKWTNRNGWTGNSTNQRAQRASLTTYFTAHRLRTTTSPNMAFPGRECMRGEEQTESVRGLLCLHVCLCIMACVTALPSGLFYAGGRGCRVVASLSSMRYWIHDFSVLGSGASQHLNVGGALISSLKLLLLKLA